MAEKGLRSSVKVGFLGKLKTTAQMMALFLLLLLDYSPDGKLISVCGVDPQMTFNMGVAALIVSALLAVLSGGQYLSAALPALLTKT